MSIANRVNTLLLLLVLFTSLALLGVLATRARGGPLDPPGAPAPSGKTLEEIPGSWSRKLPANDGSIGPTPPAGCNSTRFQCVLNNLGVLDLETGLVWTRNANPLGTPSNFGTARGVCSNLATDGRTGWRLPTLEELRSLIETTASSAPKLPSGHPFTNPQTTDSYWTTTVNAATSLFIVNLDGRAPVSEDTSVGTNTNFAWCVRGSHVADGA